MTCPSDVNDTAIKPVSDTIGFGGGVSPEKSNFVSMH